MSVVYWLRNERGFTLIEMLLVLTILLLLISFIPSFITTIGTGYELKEQSSKDVTLFLNYVANDVREAVYINIDNQKIHIKKDNQNQYLIERISSTQQIRRLRNGAGHVLMLAEVKSFQCQALDQHISCEVELLNGVKESRSMVMLYPFNQ